VRARCGWILVAALFVASAASADEPDGTANAERVAAARALFEEARRLVEAGKLPEACAKFAASNEQLPKIQTLLNLADCYEKNRQTASAWASYNDAIALGRRQGRPEYEEFAKKKTAELEPQLVHMTVTVPAEARVPGLAVERDGVRLSEGAWGTPVPVDPGTHVLRASAPKKLPWVSEIEVAPDKSITVTIPALEDAAAEVGEPPQIIEKVVVQPSFWSPLRVTGVAVASAGIAAVIVGAILGGVAKSTYDAAKELCRGATIGCPAEAVAKSDNAYTFAGVSTGLFVGGAVAAVGGAALFFAAPNPAPKRGLARLWPVVGPGSLGIAGVY
jgi:hypothetical protein